MYRLRTPVTGIPLLISEQLLREYSINKTETLHLKNLLHLGYMIGLRIERTDI